MVPALAITTLVLSVTLKITPIILLSPLFSVYIPVIVSALTIFALAVALTYALNNQNVQDDNRYKLRAELPSLFAIFHPYGLYLSEMNQSIRDSPPPV